MVERGHFIGELGVLANVYRNAAAVAVQAGEALVFSPDAFHAVLLHCPCTTRYLVTRLALQVSGLIDQLADSIFHDIPSRVIKLLRSLADRECAHDRNFLSLSPRPTHSTIAKKLGSSREVVSRACRLLEKAGELKVSGKTIFVRRSDRIN